MATQEPPSKHVSEGRLQKGGAGYWAQASGSHALTRDYVHKRWALSQQVKKRGPETRSELSHPSGQLYPPEQSGDFFPKWGWSPACEGDSARGPRVLKGHPPGCFHCVSGQNASLVSHLEMQEWAIFSFINPSANTLMDINWAWMRISTTWRDISGELVEAPWLGADLKEPVSQSFNHQRRKDQIHTQAVLSLETINGPQPHFKVGINRLFFCREPVLIISMALQECVWTFMAQRNHIPVVHTEKTHS